MNTLIKRHEASDIQATSLHCKDLCKSFVSFRRKVDVLKDITLDIEPGEFFVLLGPSGCGKSTLLNLIAGLEKPTGGQIIIGQQVVADMDEKIFINPAVRDAAMVFQSYALYPHMTVQENIAFPITNLKKKLSKCRINEKVGETARFLQIEELLQRKPAELSGGQRQRVAIGRAIVRQPKFFLMDEPLSNLDALLRMEMRAQLKDLQQHLDITTIYVTHDQMEAMTLGDRIAILHDGIIQQIGRPAEVYEHPQNPFVAGFIGSPPMNLIKGTIIKRDGFIIFKNIHSDFMLPLEVGPTLSGVNEDACIMGIRPENIDLGHPGEGYVDVNIDVVENIGSEYLIYIFMKNSKPIIVKSSQKPQKKQVSLKIPPGKIHFFNE